MTKTQHQEAEATDGTQDREPRSTDGTPAKQVPAASVGSAVGWLKELARAYGWHCNEVCSSGDRTSRPGAANRSPHKPTRRFLLNANRAEIEVRICTGRPDAPLNHPFVPYHLTIKVAELGSYIALEQWLWKLTQKTRHQAGKDFLPKTHRKPLHDSQLSFTVKTW